MIAAATLISQLILFITALFNMNRKNNLFGFSFRAISFSREVTAPMIKTSFPVAVERAAFAFGKLIVNAMSTVYGDSTVGALGVSNNIDGISTSLQNGFQEDGASECSFCLNEKRMRHRFIFALEAPAYSYDFLLNLTKNT